MHRIAKRSRFSGLVSASGKLQTVELYGPGDFETWKQSWRLYRAGCIMLAQVSVSTIYAYRDLMFHYSRRCGQVVWAIQHQADVRARLEQLERLSRESAAEASLVPNHAFCSTKPWEWCFRQLVDESAGFWRRELEDPGGLVKSEATVLVLVVEGEFLSRETT